MTTLWLTRPTSDSETMARMLAPRGIASVIAPLTEITSCPYILPSTTPDAILLTSRHAAVALPAKWSALPVYCVGEATAQAAQAAGYRHVIAGARDLLSLLPQIAATLSGKTLFYPSAADIAVDVVSLLAARNVTVTRVITYQAVAADHLPPPVMEPLRQGTLDGAVFFSARTAEIAATLLQRAEFAETAARVDAYCLSLPVAEAAAALPWRRVHVAAVPTLAALCDSIRLPGQIDS